LCTRMCVSLMNGIGIFCIYLILLRRAIKIMELHE